MVGNESAHEASIPFTTGPTTRADTRRAWRRFAVAVGVVVLVLVGLWLAGRDGTAEADAREAAGSFQAALWRGETAVAWSFLAAPRGEGQPPTAFADWAERCTTGISGNPAEWALSTEPHPDGGRAVTIDAGTRGAVVTYRVVDDPDGWRVADWTPDVACTP